LFAINVLAHDGGFYETKASASARRAEMLGVLFVSEKVRTGFYYYRCFAAQIVEIGNSLLSNFSIWHGGVRDGTCAGASPGETLRGGIIDSIVESKDRNLPNRKQAA